MADEQDVDPQETREWLDALHSVLEKEGIHRAHFLIERLVDEMRRSGAHLPYKATTAYVNTIRKSDEPPLPGDPGLAHRIRSINRWNALAMVVKANNFSKELGGHLSSYASSATLYEVAFNHFFHAPSAEPRTATWSTSRATARRASTRAPSWRGVITRGAAAALPSARWTATGSPPTPTPG